jgi:hypothetical protein
MVYYSAMHGKLLFNKYCVDMGERKLAVEKEIKSNIELVPEQTINSYSLELDFRTFTFND